MRLTLKFDVYTGEYGTSCAGQVGTVFTRAQDTFWIDMGSGVLVYLGMFLCGCTLWSSVVISSLIHTRRVSLSCTDIGLSDGRQACKVQTAVGSGDKRLTGTSHRRRPSVSVVALDSHCGLSLVKSREIRVSCTA